MEMIKIPLISKVSLEYFEGASNEEAKNYYRAFDLRLCLEKICDSIIINFVSDEKKSKWKKFTLHNKIEAAEPFIGIDLVEKLLVIKGIGNQAAHEGSEGKIDKESIIESLDVIRDFSLQVFVTYFKKNGFADDPDGSWTPVVLSTLPPQYRVHILKQYFESNKSIITIDKLSMALLKSGNKGEAISFIENCLKNNYIKKNQYNEFIIKLQMLEDSFKYLQISQNFEDSKENFKRILTVIPKNEVDIFIILMSTILIDPNDI